MRILSATAIGAALALSGTAALASPITDVCAKGGRSDAVCVCATETLAVRLAENDFLLYEDVSDAYLLRSAAGLPDQDAWDAAHAEVAAAAGMSVRDVSSRAKLAGAFHRDAMRGCR